MGSVVRQAVQETLSPPVSRRQAALDRLFQRADSAPAQPVGDWQTVKDGFERESLESVK